MPEIKQLEVLTNHLLPDELTTTPSQIDKQYFKPDLSHNISMVSGYDGEREHLAQVDSSGALKVNAAVGGYLHYSVVSGSYDDTQPTSANVTFSHYVDELDLQVSGNAVNIQLINSTTNTLGDVINLPVGFTQIKYVTNGLTIWCNVSGSSSTVQVVGWW